jgi:ABC-type bacteriocin/lantibiotic exporter with double-glycine peptidase domain
LAGLVRAGTGSGKSSLFAALLRLTDISSGRIRVDDLDVRAVSLAALRSAVTVVPQHPLVFSGALGMPAACDAAAAAMLLYILLGCSGSANG